MELRTLRGFGGRISASRPLVMQSGSGLFDDIAMWNYYREACWLSLYIRETPICCGKDELRKVIRIAVDQLTF